ncbi:MAG: tetratricopeptide repeat protein, partial [Alphaproteobacteria bacterium]
MAQQHVTRKLAAILAADVAGYSRLMGEDEEGTLRTLNAFRAVIDGLIVEHEGRVFGSAGDSVIAEFVSPVEAVRCATEIQRDLETRNTDLPEDRRMRFRIGVNLGDVMVESDDLFGDGVNVAARLETLAEPGGICLSRSIFDQVKKQLDLGYEYLGEQRVKNIAEPVRVYRVLLEPGAAGQVLGEARPAAPRWRIVAAAIAVVVLVGVAGAVAWLRPWAPDVGPVSVERTALPLPDKPSIAVLPFANVSDDPEQEYFADGMTDDLITDLSKISGLFVIARNSVFTYKGKPVKVQKVSEELGVRYVLEGSVRRAGGRVRINAQLIDATTGRHLWAERFGRDYTDIFTLQDEVVGRIVAALAVELTDAEQRQIARLPTDNLEAYDYYLRAERLGYGYGGMRANALSFYQKAIALDQKFADAYAGDARVAVDVWRFDIASVLPGPVALTRAYEAASRALALDPDNARAYSVLGIIQIVDGRHDNAIDSVRKAVSLDPNDAEAYTYLASVLTYAGRHSEALAAMETAFRLNPKPPPYFYGDLGWVLFWNRQYEKAIG